MKRIISVCVNGIGILAIVAACDSDTNGPIACTAIYAYGLSVHVQDSVTSAGLSDGVVVTIDDGSYHETLMASFVGEQFVGAGERAGTYTIRVNKTGYLQWERAGVVVTKDDCHVIGVSVTAKLQR